MSNPLTMSKLNALIKSIEEFHDLSKISDKTPNRDFSRLFWSIFNKTFSENFDSIKTSVTNIFGEDPFNRPYTFQVFDKFLEYIKTSESNYDVNTVIIGNFMLSFVKKMRESISDNKVEV